MVNLGTDRLHVRAVFRSAARLRDATGGFALNWEMPVDWLAMAHIGGSARFGSSLRWSRTASRTRPESLFRKQWHC